MFKLKYFIIILLSLITGGCADKKCANDEFENINISLKSMLNPDINFNYSYDEELLNIKIIDVFGELDEEKAIIIKKNHYITNALCFLKYSTKTIYEFDYVDDGLFLFISFEDAQGIKYDFSFHRFPPNDNFESIKKIDKSLYVLITRLLKLTNEK